jgi:cyanophycin synthetase
MSRRHGQAIGMVSIPGDRRDEDIPGDGPDRGRRRSTSWLFGSSRTRGDGPGARSCGLLSEGALRPVSRAGDPLRCARETKRAGSLRAAKPGDLVVLLPTEVEKTWKQVMDFDGVHEPLTDETAVSAGAAE